MARVRETRRQKRGKTLHALLLIMQIVSDEQDFQFTPCMLVYRGKYGQMNLAAVHIAQTTTRRLTEAMSPATLSSTKVCWKAATMKQNHNVHSVGDLFQWGLVKKSCNT